MMARHDIRWEELNGYVDGALSPEEAACVARAVASDPTLARQVALLSQLKAATRASPGDTPPMLIPAPVARRRRRGTVAALAAGGAALLVTGGLVMSLLLTAPDDRSHGWLARARADHMEWSHHARLSDSVPLGPRVYLSATQRFGVEPHFPDLSSAQLRLDRVRLVSPVGERPAAIHAGYLGTRGCRISLWITAAREGGTSPLVEHDAAGPSAYSWRTGGLRYALLSSGMPDERIRLIAEASYKATVARSLPDAETRTALRRSRIVSRPCRG